MANFNAGAIEATLTLDRSPFNRELKEAMADAKRFEQRKIQVELDIIGQEDLDVLGARLDAISDETVNLTLDIDGMDMVDDLEERLNMIRDEVVSIEVEADDDAIARLRGELKAIPDEKVTVEVDADGVGAASTQILAGTRALNGMRFAVAGIAIILPTIVPLALSAAAALGALVSATGILVAGLGVFAAVAIPAWKKYTDAVDAADGDMSKLPPQMRALRAEQENLNKALAGFGAAGNNRIYAVIGGGMRLIATVLTKARPLVDTVTIAISELITKLNIWAASPAFTEVVAFLNASFIPTFRNVTGIIGNLITFIGGIVEAFEPFSREFLGGLEAMTQGWSDWANNLSTSDRFQAFLDYVRANGPKIVDLFVSVGRAIGNIGAALAPVAGPTLDALKGLFDGIANINTSALGALLVGLSTAITLFIAVTAAVALFNLVMAANPIVLVVIAIAALVAAFIYLWKTNEGFRNFWIGLWNTIKGAAVAVADWFSGPFAGFFVAGFNAVKNALQAVGNFFVSIWNWIKGVVSAAIGVIGTILTTGANIMLAPIRLFISIATKIWGAFWNVFGGLIKAAIELAKAVINLGFAAMQFVINTVLKAIQKVVSTVWNAIVKVISQNVEAVKKVASAGWNLIKSATSTAWNAVKDITSRVWGALSGPVTSAVNAIKSVVSRVWDNIKSTTSSAWNALKGIISKALEAARSTVSGVVDRIKGIFSGAGGWLVSAGRNIIQGLIDGITSKIGQVTAKLQELTAKIPKVKGPEEVDKRLLRPAGQWIMEGFNDELGKGIEQALSMLGGFTGSIPTLAETEDRLALTSTVGSRATAAPLTKDEFIAAMSALIAEVRNSTQPLIGQYNANDKDPREIAEEWWFITKGRG